MKKLFILVLLCIIFVAPATTFADTFFGGGDDGSLGTGPGGGTTGGIACDPNLVVDKCAAGTRCLVSGDGTSYVCTPNSAGCSPACTGTQVCNQLLKKCQAPKTCATACTTGTCDPVTGTCPSGTAAGANPGADNTSLGFVSLTKIPGLDTIGNNGDLTGFLNNIYKYAIGLAAVIAVIQLIRAGIQYMLEGGFVEKKEARKLIGQTFAGLLLVLSPVIVFGIINPKILSLHIDTTGLQVPQKVPPGAALTGGTVSSETASQVLWTDSSSKRSDAETRCTAQGGTAVFTCQPTGGAVYTVPITQACKDGEHGVTVCKGNGAANQTCDAYKPVQASGTGICDGANLYTQISPNCCTNLSAGAVCCGIPVPK